MCIRDRPGGDIVNADFDQFFKQLAARYSKLPHSLLMHYARHYGSRCERLLAGISTVNELGQQFSELCFEVEIRYLVDNEWAFTSEDILYRRTKHALHMSASEIATVEQWLDRHSYQQAGFFAAYSSVS